jgi:hypothetical protein
LSDLEQKIKKKFLAFFEIFLSQNLVQKGKKKFPKTGQNRLFSVYFRELSDLEQMMKKKFFWVFSFFWIPRLIQKGPKSRF